MSSYERSALQGATAGFIAGAVLAVPAENLAGMMKEAAGASLPPPYRPEEVERAVEAVKARFRQSLNCLDCPACSVRAARSS